MSLTRLLAGAAAAVFLTSGAQAADLLIGNVANSIYNSSLFNFEGFYLGGQLGAGSYTVPEGVGVVGVVAGANFAVADGILAGVEFQGDAMWNDTGFVGAEALFLGKLGFYLTDATLLYASAGAGWVIEDPSWAIGAGIEQALTDQIAIRGEAMGTGAFGGGNGSGKLTGSLIWHMN